MHDGQPQGPVGSSGLLELVMQVRLCLGMSNSRRASVWTGLRNGTSAGSQGCTPYRSGM